MTQAKTSQKEVQIIEQCFSFLEETDKGFEGQRYFTLASEIARKTINYTWQSRQTQCETQNLIFPRLQQWEQYILISTSNGVGRRFTQKRVAPRSIETMSDSTIKKKKKGIKETEFMWHRKNMYQKTIVMKQMKIVNKNIKNRSKKQINQVIISMKQKDETRCRTSGN